MKSDIEGPFLHIASFNHAQLCEVCVCLVMSHAKGGPGKPAVWPSRGQVE